MSAFTPVANWTHAQDRAAANEIVLAYSERRQCVGDAAVDPLGAGGNAQDTAFWRGMQEWIEAQAARTTGDNRWLDHVTGVEGEDALPYYTLETLRTNASIPDGFRRATECPADWTDYADPAYSYGTIESGDIRGPWCFADLQSALDAMRWTARTGDPRDVADAESRDATTGPHDTQGEAEAALAAAWAAAAWAATSETSVPRYYHALYRIHEPFTPDSWYGEAGRRRYELGFTSIPDHRPHAATAYMRPASQIGSSYNNTDGYTQNEYVEMQDYAETTTSTRTVDAMEIETLPEPTVVTPPTRYWSVADVMLALKWAFSHTL